MASFFYCGRLSSAQLVPLQAPKHWPIIGLHRVEQTAFRRDIKDNGYKSNFTNLWLERQRNRSWIKGLDKNPQKSELVHWRQCAFCPGALKRVPSDSEKHHQKTECVLRRPPIGSWNKNCRFKRPPKRTGYRAYINYNKDIDKIGRPPM